MELLGASVHKVTLRHGHAQGRAERGDAPNGAAARRDTYYVIGSVLGPHPYQTLVREFQRCDRRRNYARRPGCPRPRATALMPVVEVAANARVPSITFIDDTEVR
jgi:tryptophan synthase beta chain